MLVESVGRMVREGWTVTDRKVTVRSRVSNDRARRTRREVADPPALVSVYDKTGLEDLVRGLHAAGVALVSTGRLGAR